MKSKRVSDIQEELRKLKSGEHTDEDLSRKYLELFLERQKDLSEEQKQERKGIEIEGIIEDLRGASVDRGYKFSNATAANLEAHLNYQDVCEESSKARKSAVSEDEIRIIGLKEVLALNHCELERLNEALLYDPDNSHKQLEQKKFIAQRNYFNQFLVVEGVESKNLAQPQSPLNIYFQKARELGYDRRDEEYGIEAKWESPSAKLDFLQLEMKMAELEEEMGLVESHKSPKGWVYLKEQCEIRLWQMGAMLQNEGRDKTLDGELRLIQETERLRIERAEIMAKHCSSQTVGEDNPVPIAGEKLFNKIKCLRVERWKFLTENEGGEFKDHRLELLDLEGRKLGYEMQSLELQERVQQVTELLGSNPNNEELKIDLRIANLELKHSKRVVEFYSENSSTTADDIARSENLTDEAIARLLAETVGEDNPVPIAGEKLFNKIKCLRVERWKFLTENEGGEFKDHRLELLDLEGRKLGYEMQSLELQERVQQVTELLGSNPNNEELKIDLRIANLELKHSKRVVEFYSENSSTTADDIARSKNLTEEAIARLLAEKPKVLTTAVISEVIDQEIKAHGAWIEFLEGILSTNSENDSEVNRARDNSLAIRARIRMFKAIDKGDDSEVKDAFVVWKAREEDPGGILWSNFELAVDRSPNQGIREAKENWDKCAVAMSGWRKWDLKGDETLPVESAQPPLTAAELDALEKSSQSSELPNTSPKEPRAVVLNLIDPHSPGAAFVGKDRGNKFRVAASCYKSDRDIAETMAEIVCYAALKSGISIKDATEVIKGAKATGGVSNKYNSASDSYGDSEIVNQNAKKFSKLFQKTCAECGIYSGREEKLGKPVVGLRTAFVPEEVLQLLSVRPENFTNPDRSRLLGEKYEKAEKAKNSNRERS